MGPSGAGKSSLLRVMNLLNSPTRGTSWYQGKNLEDIDPTVLRRQVGYVLQKPYLFGSDVRDNLVYPYRLLHQQSNFAEIARYLERVNLTNSIMDKKNHALSGGEQQRVALVRSLLVKPRMLLLDEVTAALDEHNTHLIEQLLMDEQQIQELTVLFITHSTAGTTVGSCCFIFGTGSCGFLWYERCVSRLEGGKG
jgi:putative ABC transport system ATP-binding protein